MLPTYQDLPLTSALEPFPVILTKLVTVWGFTSSKCWITASASGCSDCFSMPISIFLDESSLFSQSDPVTSGRPSVIVPVLSRTIAVTFLASSRLSASLIRIP